MREKSQWRKRIFGSCAIFIALSTALPSHGGSFMEHWNAPNEARVAKLLSERLSGNLYDVERGGEIDLAIFYTVRGLPPLAQTRDDLPNLQPYLDAPLAEPLKADIYVATTREALRAGDFAALRYITQNYSTKVDSNLRRYTQSYAETFLLEALGLHQDAEDALNAILETPDFQNLAHFSRDRSTILRRLSENALARGDAPLAVSRAQDASLSYQAHVAAVKANPAQTRGMKIQIELALAEALLSAGDINLANGHTQSALSLARASGAEAHAIRAEVILAEISFASLPVSVAAEQFQALSQSLSVNPEGPLALRIYSGLAKALKTQNPGQALIALERADQIQEGLQRRRSLHHEAYLETQKSPALQSLLAADMMPRSMSASQVPLGNQPSWIRKMNFLNNPNNLTWLGLLLAFMGILLAFVAQIRVGRARRALLVYSQNLEQSEKVAKENARRAEKNMRLAQAADEAKTAFLANMSHEIRTPMNGVLGMADVLRRTTELDRRQTEIVDAIHTSGTSLMTLLGDILDFSKIESGVLELNVAEANLREAVEAVATLMSAQARQKGLELLVRYAPDAPEIFNVDIGRVRQILLNLVGNAIKFTKTGHVLINIEITMDGSNAQTCINVLDTGIGIAEDEQSKVFADFVQVDEGRSKSYGGTGLGLSISKKLVEAMGGQISLRSRKGQGSVFSVDLPLTIADNQEGGLASEHFNAERVLIIDNNSASLKILSAQLKAWGLSSTVARKGSDGISGLLRAHKSSNPFDVVMIEQSCAAAEPSFIEALKSHSEIAHTPVILLADVTGAGSQSQSDFKAHIGKPVVGRKLLEALQFTLLSNPAAAKPKRVSKPLSRPVGVSPLPERKIKRVLLAEANPATRHVIAAFLKDKSVELSCVKDGEQALESAKTIDFDLILMDVQLRKLDGFLVTRAIRGHEKKIAAIRTPIICLSPFALGADQDLATAVGMDDFLVKPISPSSLEAMMDKWVGIKADIRKTKAAKSRIGGSENGHVIEPFAVQKRPVAL